MMAATTSFHSYSQICEFSGACISKESDENSLLTNVVAKKTVDMHNLN